MSDALIAAIDALVDFVCANASPPDKPGEKLLTPKLWEQLKALDAQFGAQVYRAGLVVPAVPVPSGCRPFGGSRVPIGEVTVRVDLLDKNQGTQFGEYLQLSDDWQQAMRILRSAAAPPRTSAGQGEQAGTSHEQGGTGQEAGSHKKHRKRGRPTDTDPKADEKIWDAWRTGEYKTYEGLARAFTKPMRDVRAALERHRKRLERGGG
jgi:hypothetical protein